MKFQIINGLFIIIYASTSKVIAFIKYINFKNVYILNMLSLNFLSMIHESLVLTIWLIYVYTF